MDLLTPKYVVEVREVRLQYIQCDVCLQMKTRMQSSSLTLPTHSTTSFNNLNRNVLLHNIKYACPEISTYVINCYSDPARLFVISGLELKSQEGRTQGDPLGMAVYALRITPMMNILLMAIGDQHNKMVGFADAIAAAGSIEALKR